MPGAACDGRPEQCPADPRERIEDHISGDGEELDQAGHKSRRLVGTVLFAYRVSEFGRIRRPPNRFGEIEPFLARKLVERVVGVSWAHPSSLTDIVRSPRGPVRRGRWCEMAAREKATSGYPRFS